MYDIACIVNDAQVYEYGICLILKHLVYNALAMSEVTEVALLHRQLCALCDFNHYMILFDLIICLSNN